MIVGEIMKINKLLTVTQPKPICELDKDQLKELQLTLTWFGYPIGDIDGLIGPKTRNAWAEFKTDVYEGNPELIGPKSIAVLIEKLEKINNVDDYKFDTEEDVIESIKFECKAQDIGSPEQIAYVLATVKWETAHTFKPVKEAFWLSEEWRKMHLKYYPYYGRGYVQLTWVTNYKKYTQIMGVDLVNDPDLALNPKNALFILVHGFKTGAFTGKKITDFINSYVTDFYNARRCINGLDGADNIKKIAENFLKNL